MPANIATQGGRALAVYIGERPWHGLGTVHEDGAPLTPEQAIAEAGTGYTVDLAPVFARVNGNLVEMPDRRATYRTDTGALLGDVSSDYVPIQNVTPMQLLGEVVRTKEAGIVAHAALGKGERLFAVLDLSKLTDLRVQRDPSRHYGFLVAQWWHDGTGSLSIGPYTMRVDCWNMAEAQLGWAEGRGLLVRIAHRGKDSVVSAVEQARRILGFAEERVDAWMGFLNELAEVSLPTPTDRWLDGFLERLVPIPADMDRPVARLGVREAIAHLVNESPTLVGVPSSPYRVFQAVSEYADHYRPVRGSAMAEARFKTAVGGQGSDLKQDALALLRQEFEIVTK